MGRLRGCPHRHRPPPVPDRPPASRPSYPCATAPLAPPPRLAPTPAPPRPVVPRRVRSVCRGCSVRASPPPGSSSTPVFPPLFPPSRPHYGYCAAVAAAGGFLPPRPSLRPHVPHGGRTTPLEPGPLRAVLLAPAAAAAVAAVGLGLDLGGAPVPPRGGDRRLREGARPGRVGGG